MNLRCVYGMWSLSCVKLNESLGEDRAAGNRFSFFFYT